MSTCAFSAKLRELRQDCELLENCLSACDSLTLQQLHKQFNQTEKACMALNCRLDADIQNGRCAAVVQLAQAQKDYYQTAQKLQKQQLVPCFQGDMLLPGEDRSEAAMLYTEYAIDFARHAIYQAMLSALAAMEEEIHCAQKNEKNEEEKV